MKPNNIDFAPQTVWRAVLQTRPLTWLFGALGVFIFISALIATSTFEQRRSLHEAERQRSLPSLDLPDAKAAITPKTNFSAAQASAVNGAIEQLNLPWNGLFDVISQATPNSVALLELEPDAKRHVIKGVAEVASSEGMIDYIRRLKRQGFFGKVILTKHEISSQDPNKPLRFFFEAEWLEPVR